MVNIFEAKAINGPFEIQPPTRKRCCANPLVMSLDSLPPYVSCKRCGTVLGEDGLLPSGRESS